MSYKSSSINLWDTETKLTKLDIDCHNDRIDISTTGAQPVKILTALHLKNENGVDITNVAQKLTVIEADITTNQNVANNGITVVDNDLQGYKTSNNSTVAALSSTVAANKAISDSNHSADNAARETLKLDLESDITAESNAARAAEAVNAAAVVNEANRAAAAEAALNAVISGTAVSLDAKITVEKLRIDSILDGSNVDTDNLAAVVAAYNNVDSNILTQISSLISNVNNLNSIVNQLTEGSNGAAVLSLETVIGDLLLTNGAAFLDKNFTLTYDMTDLYSTAASALIGWPAYKMVLVTSSGGFLTGSSTDEEIRAFLQSTLDVIYGQAVVDNTLEAYKLVYSDPAHYLLETGLVAGSKPYFKGAVVNTASNVDWRLTYCSVAGDSTSKYSTILSGTALNKQLTITPNVGQSGVEFPVSGLSGVRDGYKASIKQLTLN